MSGAGRYCVYACPFGGVRRNPVGAGCESALAGPFAARRRGCCRTEIVSRGWHELSTLLESRQGAGVRELLEIREPARRQGGRAVHAGLRLILETRGFRGGGGIAPTPADLSGIDAADRRAPFGLSRATDAGSR